jgi:hypothetical protein
VSGGERIVIVGDDDAAYERRRELIEERAPWS